jgi:hypothetical protein
MTEPNKRRITMKIHPNDPTQVAESLDSLVERGVLQREAVRVTGHDVPYGAQYRQVYWVEPPIQTVDGS